MLFDKFENKYIITGTLVAKMPIHIGKGNEDLNPTAVDNGVIKNKYGEPVIPGSSLKGVIRSYIERLLSSNLIEEYRGCLIVNEPCIDDKKAKEIRGNKDEKQAAQDIYNNICDVCKLFGCNHFASKINISDAVLLEGTTANFDIRDGVAIDRDTLTAADGKKYNFECVSAGTKFEFKMTCENLEKKQIKLLKIIVRLLKEGELKVGGKTSAGLGDIQLINEKIYKINKDNLEKYLTNGLSALNGEEW